MKPFIFGSLVLFISQLMYAGPVPTKGAVVNTGVITAIDREAGGITIHSAETQSPIRFLGLDRATIQFANGTPASFSDVAMSQMITVQYDLEKDIPIVHKVLLPNPEPAGNTNRVTGSAAAPLRTQAAQDGDITTQPGRAARIDGDITTQPGQAAAIDGDPTTQPGRAARGDGDITTRPGRTHPRDPDITKTPAEDVVE